MVKRSKKASEQTSNTTRISVTIPAAHYAELERIAKEKRVSVAWVVRDAIRDYLSRDFPLFKGNEQDTRHV